MLYKLHHIFTVEITQCLFLFFFYNNKCLVPYTDTKALTVM